MTLARRLVNYLVPHMFILICAISCMMIYAVFHAASIYPLKLVMDNVFLTSSPDLSFTVPYLNYHIEFTDRLQFLKCIAAVIAIAYLFKSAAQFGQGVHEQSLP